MVIQHRPARRHCNADALSRLPVPPGGCGTRMDVHTSDLPCGDCPKYKRPHDNWNGFAEEVDDVGILSKQGCWTGIWGSTRILRYRRLLLVANPRPMRSPWGMFREACWALTAAPCSGSWTSRSRDARRGVPYQDLSEPAPLVCVRAGFGSGSPWGGKGFYWTHLG